MLISDTLGILYLIVVKLGVIAAGIVSILCGYRLFLVGAFGQAPGQSHTDVGARLGVMQVSLKSAAPGTCFALFGAFIIMVMVFSAPPEVHQTHTKATFPVGGTKETLDETMRGSVSTFDVQVQKAMGAEKAGDKQSAIRNYESALRLVAEPLNNLAVLYHHAGRTAEALSLAQLATQFAPNEPEFLKTLKEIRGSE